MGIFNSPIIEVGIGLVLLYLVFGLIVTPINEFVAQAYHIRAEMLWDAIRCLLHDKSGRHAAKELYNHHLIRSLAVQIDEKDVDGDEDPNLRGKPSYIPAEFFSLALIDIIAKPGISEIGAAEETCAGLLANMPKSGLPGQVQQALAPPILSTTRTLDEARSNIEAYTSPPLDRTS